MATHEYFVPKSIPIAVFVSGLLLTGSLFQRLLSKGVDRNAKERFNFGNKPDGPAVTVSFGLAFVSESVDIVDVEGDDSK